MVTIKINGVEVTMPESARLALAGEPDLYVNISEFCYIPAIEIDARRA
jgi:NADH dehydrogenase/NADH:ubiquinone oxidoreductase subunit G